MNVLNELKSRIEWLGEAARLVEAGELQPTVAEHTLKRYLRTPARSVITYCDVDADAGYSDTGDTEVHEAEVRTQYLCKIGALEAAIAKRRDKEYQESLQKAIEGYVEGKIKSMIFYGTENHDRRHSVKNNRKA